MRPAFRTCGRESTRPQTLQNQATLESGAQELADMVMGSRQRHSSRNASEEAEGEAMMQPDPIIDTTGIAQRQMKGTSTTIASPSHLSSTSSWLK